MQGLIPTRLTHFVLEDGSVRPFLVVAVLPANTITQDDPCGQYDKGIVNGILFRDGLNDTTATAHQEEKHSSPLMEWLSGVRFDSNSIPGTWHFTQGAPQPVTANGVQPPDFIGKIINRVQDLLADHAESIKRMLAEAGARNVELPPVAIASPGLQAALQAEGGPLAHEVGKTNELDTSGELAELAAAEKGKIVHPEKVGKDEWSPDLSYKVGDRVTYLGKDWVAIAASAGVVPGSEGAESFWRELKALPEWSKEELYMVGNKVTYKGAEYIATRSSVDFAPGSEDAKGYWSPISGALHAFLESGGGFGNQAPGADAISGSEDATQGTAAEQK